MLSPVGPDVMQANWPPQSDIGGAKAIDAEFIPDQLSATERPSPVTIGKCRVIHTPGHIGNHISPAVGRTPVSSAEPRYGLGQLRLCPAPGWGARPDFMASLRDCSKPAGGCSYPGQARCRRDRPCPRDWIGWSHAIRLSQEARIYPCVAPRTRPATAAGALPAENLHETPACIVWCATPQRPCTLIDLKQKNKMRH